MRKKFIQLIIGLSFMLPVTAQNNGVVSDGKFGIQVFVSDLSGRPFENKYGDISGSPYLDQNFKYAVIHLSQGRVFANIPVKLDLNAQALLFITANGEEAFSGEGVVKEISYLDTTLSGVIPYKFQTGFEAIDKQTVNNFYQVIVEGRCGLVKSIFKNISVRKNELSGEVTREFETNENYYLVTGNVLKKLKKDKGYILSILSDKQPQVEQFIQSNKINCKNIDQLSKLITYYNSL